MQHFIGTEAAKALKASYRTHGIKYTEPRRLTEAQKAVMRERLATYRQRAAAKPAPAPDFTLDVARARADSV